MNTRKAYDSDVTDAQWNWIQGMFSERPAGVVGRPAGVVGRPREYRYREIFNAIQYLLRTGCQWRNLPHDFPPYTLVSYYYHAWRKSGLVQRLHDALRTQVRRQEGREAEPSVLLINSHSSKTTEKGGRKNLTKRRAKPLKLSAMTLARTSKAANATLP